MRSSPRSDAWSPGAEDNRKMCAIGCEVTIAIPRVGSPSTEYGGEVGPSVTPPPYRSDGHAGGST